MSEEKRKPFNVGEYTGQAVETRSGERVIALHVFPGTLKYPVHFLLAKSTYLENVTKDGKYEADSAANSEYDLFFSPTKKTAYLVVDELGKARAVSNSEETTVAFPASWKIVRVEYDV
jgi:hypothetical protein